MQRKCQMSGLQSPVVARGLESLSWWHTSNPGPAQCGHHSDESWSRLSHVEIMDRWGESEELPITHPTKTQLITSALTLHVHRHTQRHKTPRKNRRNKRWASNQRALQQLNQHRLSDEQEHFWFLWAAAFINHPQKKHHSTTTWVEDALFCCSLCRAQEKKMEKEKG